MKRTSRPNSSATTMFFFISYAVLVMMHSIILVYHGGARSAGGSSYLPLLLLGLPHVSSAQDQKAAKFADNDWPQVFWQEVFRAKFPADNKGKVQFCEDAASPLKITVRDHISGPLTKSVKECNHYLTKDEEYDALAKGVHRASVLPWAKRLCSLTLPALETTVKLNDKTITQTPCSRFPYKHDQESRVNFLRAGAQFGVPLSWADPATPGAVNVSVYNPSSQYPREIWTVIIFNKNKSNDTDPVRLIYSIFKKVNWPDFCTAAYVLYKIQVRIEQAARPPNPAHLTRALVNQDCGKPSPIPPLPTDPPTGPTAKTSTGGNSRSSRNSNAASSGDNIRVIVDPTTRLKLLLQKEDELLRSSENGVLLALALIFLLVVPLGVVYMNWPNRNCL